MQFLQIIAIDGCTTPIKSAGWNSDAFVIVSDVNFFACSLAGEHVWNLPNERHSGGMSYGSLY